jgi:hypothetical protein
MLLSSSRLLDGDISVYKLRGVSNMKEERYVSFSMQSEENEPYGSAIYSLQLEISQVKIRVR